MANSTNWLNISAMSGSSGQTILTLSAQRNLATDYKTAEITAYNPVYNISAKTYVTIESYTPFINVEPSIVGVPESGGTYQLSISSNCAYVIAYPDLVASYSTTAATGNTTITFSVTGTSADTTLVGNIVITDESGQVSKTVRVEQYGQGAQISYWPGYLNFPSSGGSGNIGVSANCVYTVTKSEGADWFSVYPSSGYTGRSDFTVTITDENTGSTVRTGYVFINGPGNAGGVVQIRQNVAETRLVVYYNVRTTSSPTNIFSSSTSFSKAELANGTELSLSDTGYTFSSTGRQAVYYTLTGTSIGVSSFNLCYDLVDVIIPNGVTTIGHNAFGVTDLSALTLPDTVTSIGDHSFTYTQISSLNLGTGLTNIGSYAFAGTSGLTTVNIPPSVTNIGNYAFSGSTASKFYFSSPTPATLGTSALNSTNLTEIIVPCVYFNAYITAWPQYEQYISCQDTELYFITDTSNVKGIGETRTITILNTNINPNRTGLNLPSDFPAQGSYVVDGNTIYLTYPANPSSSSTRTWTIGVVAQTNDGESLSGSYRITQNAYVVVPIPYTADTSTVDASGETRTITIDTSGLVESSITISVEGATGVTTTYQNGVITVVFPENNATVRNITVTITGTTTNGDLAKTTIVYQQASSITLKTPLIFVFTSNGQVKWTASDSSYTKTIEYNKNGSGWTSITSSTGGTSIPVSNGDIVMFRGNNTGYATGTTMANASYNTFCGTTGTFNVVGNIMSLIDSVNYSTVSSLTATYTFFCLFKHCTGITNTIQLFLPATSLTDYCYTYLFAGCSGLTTAPELPATTLASNCYNNMFNNCTRLSTAPELPATTLAPGCYWGMFWECTNLTTAPELPAMSLSPSCYEAMFFAAGLTTAPELSATGLASSCYMEMFRQCTNLTTAPELPATVMADYCYYRMFYGCTSLVTAPSVLPATTLASNCYGELFYNCSNINYIKCFATDISATDCTRSWVYGVAPTGTFVKVDTMTGWTIGRAGIPSGWTIENVPGPGPEPVYSGYLQFNITSNGDIKWTASDSSYTKTIEYNKNNSGWTSITSSTGGTSISVTNGDIIQFRGDNATYATGSQFYNRFRGTASFYLEGNIMSLINSTGFSTATTLQESYTFYKLFTATGLTDASELELPATALTPHCYDSMFNSCPYLTKAPELPATTLASYCYSYMFSYSNRLTTPPSRIGNSATTMAEGACSYMFNQCSGLTTAPELPATILATNCYDHMFWLCESLTAAPVLPATTLTEGCYQYMFSGCSALNYIKCLAIDRTAINGTANWVGGVAASGTFVTPSSTNWTTGNNGIPTGWTRVDA